MFAEPADGNRVGCESYCLSCLVSTSAWTLVGSDLLLFESRRRRVLPRRDPTCLRRTPELGLTSAL